MSSFVLNREEILNSLKTDKIGKNLICLESVNSTNLYAKENHSLPHGTVIIADKQTEGRGRLGRKWISNSCEGLWMSALLKPQISPDMLSTLTLVIGLAVLRALKKVTNLDFKIKWPNDIVLEKRKICGILAEISAKDNMCEFVVCGIGINLNTESFPEEICNIAGSLYMSTGKKFSKNTIAAEVINELEPLYSEFIKNGISNLISEYKQNCINIGCDVVINENGKSCCAVAVDVSKSGELIIELDGQNRAVTSGEVSVRGLLGYV